MTTIILSITTALLVLAFLYLGGWEWIGSKVVLLLPQATLQQGDKAVIFLNGRYRGRFYGWGVDTNDGSRLVFLKYRKHYRLVRLAEYIRKCFRVIEDEANLVPDCTDIPTDKEESEVSDEK